MTAGEGPSARAARLSHLLEPASIAVVGASEGAAKVGGRLLGALLFNGYSGKLYPINPGRAVVQGLRAYASLQAVGADIDLAVLCIPAPEIEAEVERACRAGVRSLIVLASGFAEFNAEGAATQARIARTVRRHGVSLVGPNCLGMMNASRGILASHTVTMQGRRLAPGSIAVVSQSGALGTVLFDMVLDAGFGVSKWLSTGNEADVDAGTALEYLVEDEATRVVLLYIEGIRDGLALRRGLIGALRRRKPVIVLRSGKSRAGAAAVSSHTGNLVGRSEASHTLLEQFGACEVDSMSEMIDVARIFLTQHVPLGRRTCVFSGSGGGAVLMADACAAAGLEVPPFSERTTDLLTPHFPDYAAPHNPIDLTTQIVVDPHMLEKCLRVIVQSGEFDAICLYLNSRSDAFLDILAPALMRILPQWHGGHALVWHSGTAQLRDALRAAGVATFDDIPQAARALGGAMGIVARWDGPVHPRIPELRAFESTEPLTEYRSKCLLRERAGLRCPNGSIVRAAGEVREALRGITAPYAAKLQSPDVPHKSGSGGLRLGLRESASAEEAVAAMLQRAARSGWRSEGVLIEEMIEVRFEFLVALRQDPVLGPLLVVGRGGIAVEVDPDIARAFLPLDAAAIEAMLRRLRASPLFGAFRGEPPVRLDSLAGTICRLQELFLADESLAEIEINPLACRANGDIVALDATVRRGTAIRAAGESAQAADGQHSFFVGVGQQ